jgi:Sensors of blue-light using FAD
MLELIYRSRLASDLNLPEVYAIMKEARQRNDAMSVTGVLLFNTQYFLQLIEGPKESIEALYPRIEKDRRHQNVECLVKRAITERSWANWSMALVMPTADNQHILKRYSASGIFSPIDLTAKTASQLLTDLARQGVVGSVD